MTEPSHPQLTTRMAPPRPSSSPSPSFSSSSRSSSTTTSSPAAPWAWQAIVGFVLSLVMCFLWPLGLLFSILGIVATRDGSKRGLGLAVAGTCISAAMGGLMVIGMLLGPDESATTTPTTTTMTTTTTSGPAVTAHNAHAIAAALEAEVATDRPCSR